jgi:hypothetical protein
VRGLAGEEHLVQLTSLIETCLPPHRTGVGLNHVLCMASDTAIVGLSGAGCYQFAVRGAASGADPFGGRGRIAHLLCRSSSGGQLLQRPADKLRRFGGSPGCKRGTNGIVRGRYSVAQTHQGLDRIL